MKWMCVTNSCARSPSKPFFVPESSPSKDTNSDRHLTVPPHPFGVYALTRVNPLYVEDSNAFTSIKSIVSLPELTNDCIKKHCCKTDYLHEKSLRDDAHSVLKQNSNFIRSILVSIRLSDCHKNKYLTPIPEGKTDSIPRPVWSNNEQLYTVSGYNESGTQKHPFRCKLKRSKKKSDTSCPTIVESASIMATVSPNRSSKSLSEILRELSTSINNAMENTDLPEIPPEMVLQSLREKINRFLDSCSMAVDMEPQAANLKYNAVATLSRAFNFANSFNHGSQEDELEKGRLQLLKRLGRFPASDQAYQPVGRSSSSSSTSSSTSTSGFSDLTHTPASSNTSASESPPTSRIPVGGDHLSANACENRENNTLVACASENVIVCKNSNNSLCDNSMNQLLFNSSFEYRMVQQDQTGCVDVRNFSNRVNIKGLKVASGYTRSDAFISCYPGHRCPDFTLDVQQAEMVMKKIEERKKERCWCRVITSFVGFIFLLFAVMFFSMMLTRGEKIFGSL